MENINNKANELKVKVLEIIDKKLQNENIDINELRNCVECINAIQKDEMAYWKNIASTFGAFNGIETKSQDKKELV